MFFLPTLIGAASTGLNFFGQRSQARQAEENAKYNAAVSRINAQFDLGAELSALKIERMQNEARFAEAQLNHTLAKSEAESRIQNAERLRQFGEVRTHKSREAIRRRRRDFERFQGTQRARIGGSGVTEQGSPLELLAETAGEIELSLAEMQRESFYEDIEIQNAATLEERDGRLQGVLANAELDAAGNSLAVSQIVSGINESAAQYRYSSAVSAAGLGLSGASSYASGQRLASYGTLLSGAASWIGQRSRARYTGMIS